MPRHRKRRSLPTREGRLDHKGRFAFLLAENPGEQDVMIRGTSLRLAMNGDRVVAAVRRERSGYVGEIVKVLERAHETVVGALCRRGPHWWVEPHAKTGLDHVRVLGFEAKGSPNEGDLAVARIERWPTSASPAAGRVVEILGDPEAPGVRLEAIALSAGVPRRFSKQVQVEARRLPAAPDVSGRRRVPGPVFTIDGADAKDFDDAVSIEKRGRGWRLGVHIADVSHYVRPGSGLDDEGRARATSIYLPGRVIPMLPPKLSDDLCSLRPRVPRLAMSCTMEVDADGKIGKAAFEPAWIRSDRRFTYEEVQTILDGGGKRGEDPAVVRAVRWMGRLAALFTRRRMERGGLDFDKPEYEVEIGPSGEPTSIVRRDRLESHRLIEEFMIAANEAAARHLKRSGIPFLYRVHERPDPEKLRRLADTVRRLGVKPAVSPTAPGGLQALLRAVKTHPLGETIGALAIRSLKQAVYSHRPGRHYGLASEAYCHFTSPIRRYPDLSVHRALKASLSGRKKRRGPDERLAELAAHCSRRERAASEAEWRATDVLRAQVLLRRKGQVHDGIVVRAASAGAFVELKGTGASGLVRNASLQLGDRVRVSVRSADLTTGDLELTLRRG